MKFIFLFACLLNLNLHAQKGIVYYGQIKSPGMKSAAGPDLNAYLVFNKGKSYYVTAKDSLESAHVRNKSIYKGDGEQQAAYNGDKTTEFGEQVYFNRDKDSLWWSERFGGYIYIKEKRPTIDWELKKETKEIGNFKAKKPLGSLGEILYGLVYNRNTTSLWPLETSGATGANS